MFLDGKRRVLVLAPHTDDGELGCGGSISRFIEEGKEVFYVAFSSCEESLRPELPKDTLIKEVKEATAILGIPSENLILEKFKVRYFFQNRQDILDRLIQIKNEIRPDLVIIPQVMDLHQDHKIVAEEAVRAFKQITILSYEMPWNNISFETNVFIKLKNKHIEKKIKALKEYKSQDYRTYLTPEFIKGLAKTRGVQIGCEYAEVFELIRLSY